MRCLIICNEWNSANKQSDYKEVILSKLNTKYEEIIFWATTGVREDTINIIKENQEVDLLLVCGGDGTFNEVVNGIYLCDKKPPIGYLPMGTCNDFARGRGLPETIEEGLEVILKGTPHLCNAIKVGDMLISYVMGSGLFSDVSYTTGRDAKNKFGRMAYYFNPILKPTMPAPQRVTVEANGQVYDGKYTLFGCLYNKRMSGFKINSGEKYADKFIIFGISAKKTKTRNMFRTLGQLGKCIFFDIRKVSKKKHLILDADEATLKLYHQIDWTCDGEKYTTQEGELQVKLIQNAFSIIK